MQLLLATLIALGFVSADTTIDDLDPQWGSSWGDSE